MRDVVEIFWDNWRGGELGLHEFEHFLRSARVQPSCPKNPWLRAWLMLFEMHCRVQNRTPAVLVRQNGDHRGDFIEDWLKSSWVNRVMTTVNIAQGRDRDDYELGGSRAGMDYGIVGAVQGVGFLWYGARTGPHTSYWGQHRGNAVGARVWPGHPPDRWINATGGKKIEFNFFEFVPDLGAEAQRSVKGLLGASIPP